LRLRRGPADIALLLALIAFIGLTVANRGDDRSVESGYTLLLLLLLLLMLLWLLWLLWLLLLWLWLLLLLLLLLLLNRADAGPFT